MADSVGSVAVGKRKELRYTEFIGAVLFWLGLIAGVGGWAFDSMKGIGLGAVLELGCIAAMLDIANILRKRP